MKKVTLIFVMLLSLNFAFGQITPEQSYDHSGTYTALANSGDKFFYMHVGTEQCRINNTDHTPWKTINLSVPTGHWLYDIRYVSENLFTTDNTVCLAYIYYRYDEVGDYYEFNATVIREDGEILLEIPGCQYIYVHTLSDESVKMVAYSYDYSLTPYSMKTHVYDLPGQTTSFDVEENTNNVSRLNAFPNPAQTYATIPYELPAAEQSGTLVFMNAEGKTIRSIPVDQSTSSITIETTPYPRGIYFYHLQTGNWKSQSRKLIVN